MKSNRSPQIAGIVGSSIAGGASSVLAVWDLVESRWVVAAVHIAIAIFMGWNFIRCQRSLRAATE